MAKCNECGLERPDHEVQLGVCDECFNNGPPQGQKKPLASSSPITAKARLLPLTTGFDVPNREIDEIIKIVGAEAVLGLSIFKDIANSWRDVLGGRSSTSQVALSDARELCLKELSENASKAGADAVIGVRVTVSEISTSGAGLLVVAATGTAVRLKAV